MASNGDGKINYVGMTYDQMLKAWSSQPQYARDYKPFELEAIHRRWQRLGKLAAAGRL